MFKGAGIRSVILNSLLFLSLIISHHLGGGVFVLTHPTILVVIISSIIFWIRPIKEFKGPLLAAVLVSFQLIGHMCAPVSSNHSDLRMFSSHAIAVFMTYAIAKNFDGAICVFENVISYLFGSTIYSLIKIQNKNLPLPHDDSKQVGTQSYLERLFGRAPPIFLGAELLSISQ